MERSEKKSFRLLDLALILLAVFAVIGVWQRENLKRLFVKEEILEDYVITFEIKKVRSTTAQLLQKDVALYTQDEEENIALGVLTQPVAVSPATVYLPHHTMGEQTLEMVEAVYPLDDYEYYQDAGGELACRGIERDGSFFVGGKLLLVKGQQIQAKSETVDVLITVTDYRKAD
jgi:hypothetical protein